VFRDERRALVSQYISWAGEDEPDVDAVHKRLSQFTDTDSQRAYCNHVAARWAGAPNPIIARQVAALVPLALYDATLLDALSARLVAIDLAGLANRDLNELIDVVELNLTTGQPWAFGQWR
jgi:hypothetical protein